MDMQTETSKTQPVLPAKRRRPNYLLVLIFLIAFTAIEVGVSYMTSGIRVPLLLSLAFVKATLVILYFMHLRFDSRVYAWWFLIGLALIIPLGIVLGGFNPGQ
jgi:cytochrome c oxidase subunit IV